MVVANKNVPNKGCEVNSAHQIAQTHPNCDCNEYNYTLWSKNPECELYIGAEGFPEIFYVRLKPCPPGFFIQEAQKASYCDPLLNTKVVAIISCYLDEEAVLCPGDSWIYADTGNVSHTYRVSPNCPFDYCILHSTHHNFQYHDSRCQFKRTGVLCGQCQHGLSTVFGSYRCKQCSNVYLLIVIPIAIAGVVLVVMLFIFNLTVTSGVVNTFVFYVNIISINVSLFFLFSNAQCNNQLCTSLNV